MKLSFRLPALALAGLFAAGIAAQTTPATYSIKNAKSALPKEVKEAIGKLLDEKSVQLQNAKGETVVEVWFRKEVPVKATEAQIKNGLTYQEVPPSTILAVMRVHKVFTDYRKQRVPPGTYTLRIAQQPQDGDHMGTAPYSDFVLVSPAADDAKADLLDAKALNELSGKTTEGHPSVLLLFPGTGAAEEAKLASKDGGHRIILIKLPAKAGDKKATLPLGLTLIGASTSA